MAASIIIDVKWTIPSDTSGITSYNVYKVLGAGEEDAKSLLAIVTGSSSTSYLFTSTRCMQYQFEVRATGGTNEPDPLEIYYRNGTTLYTPTIIAPPASLMIASRLGTTLQVRHSGST